MNLSKLGSTPRRTAVPMRPTLVSREENRNIQGIGTLPVITMAEQSIISIGYEIPGRSDWYHSFASGQSLLDADIVVIAPDLDSYSLDSSHPHFQGHPSYSDSSSFRIREHSAYWRQELKTALAAGKTVFVLFRAYQPFYIHTGQKQWSGTGRNARGTNIVEEFDNYRFLPITVPTMVPRSGKNIVSSGHPTFATFWNFFKADAEYESYLDGPVEMPLFTTKTGGKPVGALFKVGAGHLVLLPSLDYDYATFVKTVAKTKSQEWTKDALKFGGSLVKALVEIDKALRRGGERTPPPEWLSTPSFALTSELALQHKIQDIDKKVAALAESKAKLVKEAEKATELKDLLFEKGKRLEHAIGLGLQFLGYSAENFNDGNLEIDHVILSPEGDRFIGEAEGKDSSAVNIDKFRQLTSNIQEDLQRVEVNEPAAGILFGNGYRLTLPAEREEQFTEKCRHTAKASRCALVRTSDLFQAARYLSENFDPAFAALCRATIKEAIGGIVSFPPVPEGAQGR